VVIDEALGRIASVLRRLTVEIADRRGRAEQAQAEKAEQVAS
jgi:hypothetical protein